MEEVFVVTNVISNEFLKLENLIRFSTMSMGFEIKLAHSAFLENLIIVRKLRTIINSLETHFKKKVFVVAGELGFINISLFCEENKVND